MFCCLLTHVVVPRDRHAGPGARALLREVVPELEDAGVVLQHGGDLHLHRVSQLLPLWRHAGPCSSTRHSTRV